MAPPNNETVSHWRLSPLSQLCPLLQVLAGSIALGFCGKLGLAVPGDTAQNIQSFGGGFLATVVTAACIWLPGLLIGAFLSASGGRQPSDFIE